MTLRVIIISLVLILTLQHQTLHGQSPWAQGKGHGYGQYVLTVIPSYNVLFGGSEGSRQTERFISETILASYAEIGITDQLTFSLTTPVISVSTGEASPDVNPTLPSDNLRSLGNISFSPKYTFGKKSWKFAIQPRIDIPTSTRDEVSGLSTGVNALTILPAASIGNSGDDWYYYGFFGYGFRSNEHNDFLNYGIEGGKHLDDRLTVIINITRLENIDNGNPLVDSPANIETGLYTSFQEFTGYNLKFFINDIFKGFGAFASLGGGFNANSVAASPALSLGVFSRW